MGSTLSHIKSFAGLIWFAIKNWRMLWHVHTKLQENEPLNEAQEVREAISECEECTDRMLCPEHAAQWNTVREKLEQQSEELRQRRRDMQGNADE